MSIDADKLILVLEAVSGVLVICFVIWKINKIWRTINAIVNDTLKHEEDGRSRFSKSNLTSFTAWLAVLTSYFLEQLLNGFHELAWFGLLLVAIGVKSADALAKYILSLKQKIHGSKEE